MKDLRKVEHPRAPLLHILQEPTNARIRQRQTCKVEHYLTGKSLLNVPI